MKRQRQEATTPEIRLRDELLKLGLQFEIQKQILPCYRRRADFVFTHAKVAVLVDGCFWHACPLHATWPKANADWWRTKIERNQLRDRDTDTALVTQGWAVLRVWEHELAEAAAVRVDAVVTRRTGGAPLVGEIVPAP